MSSLFEGLTSSLLNMFQDLWEFIVEKLDVAQWTNLSGLWSYIGTFFPSDIVSVLSSLLVIYVIIALKRAVFS